MQRPLQLPSARKAKVGLDQHLLLSSPTGSISPADRHDIVRTHNLSGANHFAAQEYLGRFVFSPVRLIWSASNRSLNLIGSLWSSASIGAFRPYARQAAWDVKRNASDDGLSLGNPTSRACAYLLLLTLYTRPSLPLRRIMTRINFFRAPAPVEKDLPVSPRKERPEWLSIALDEAYDNDGSSSKSASPITEVYNVAPSRSTKRHTSKISSRTTFTFPLPNMTDVYLPTQRDAIDDISLHSGKADSFMSHLADLDRQFYDASLGIPSPPLRPTPPALRAPQTPAMQRARSMDADLASWRDASSVMVPKSSYESGKYRYCVRSTLLFVCIALISISRVASYGSPSRLAWRGVQYCHGSRK